MIKCSDPADSIKTWLILMLDIEDCWSYDALEKVWLIANNDVQ